METKDLKGLVEAYAFVYPQQEEVLEETIKEEKIAHGTGKKLMPSAKERSKLAKRARAGEDIGHKGAGFKKVAAKAAKEYGSKEAGARVAAAAMFAQQARAHKEEFEGDLFDYLLEYLVAEGYADTNKAAINIMANMSEEWRNSIIEDYKEFPTAKVMNKAGKLMGSAAGKTDPDSKKKEKRGIKMMDTMMQHTPDKD